MNRGDIVWLMVLGIILALLFAPASHAIFVGATKTHPFIMGFIKFAVLATMGELLAIRIAAKAWKIPVGMIYRTVIWGLLGIAITLVFELFASGVTSAIAKGLLYVGDSFPSFLSAFYISALMNLIFGPTFMAFHRITDTYIDLFYEDGRVDMARVIARIDWQGFIQFVVIKTIPLFWIPVHTIVFLLPPEYRILAAAFLSIALGAILAYAKR